MASGAKAMKALQIWCKQRTEGYRDVSVTDMTKSWRDGLAFCALIHKYRPDLIDYDSLSSENVFENNKMAFEVAERELGIPALLDAEDMFRMRVPDRLSIITYVAQMYNYFKDYSPLGGPEVKKYRGPSQAKKRQTDSPATVPETKKFTPAAQVANKTKEVTPTHTKEKTRTIGDTCTICSKKVYILERVRIDGKFYHRSCYRESQNKNKEYTSVLLKKTPEKSAVGTDKKKTDKTNVTSPTSVAAAKARSNFFQDDNVSNKSIDSGYQSPGGWKRNDINALSPDSGARKNKSLSSPTSPVLTAVSNSLADVPERNSESDDPWVLRNQKNKVVKDKSPVSDSKTDRMDRLRGLKGRSPLKSESPAAKSTPAKLPEKPTSPFAIPPSYERKSRCPEQKHAIGKKSPTDTEKTSMEDDKGSPMEVDKESPRFEKKSDFKSPLRKDAERTKVSPEKRHSPMEIDNMPPKEEIRKSRSPVAKGRHLSSVGDKIERRSKSPEKTNSGFVRDSKSRSPEAKGKPLRSDRGKVERRSKSPDEPGFVRDSKSRSPEAKGRPLRSDRDKVERRSKSPEKTNSGFVRDSKSRSPEAKDRPLRSDRDKIARRSKSPDVGAKRSRSPEHSDHGRKDGSAEKIISTRNLDRKSRSPDGNPAENKRRSPEKVDDGDRKSRSPEKKPTPFKSDGISPVETRNDRNRSPFKTSLSPADHSVPRRRSPNNENQAMNLSEGGHNSTAIGRLDALVHQNSPKEGPSRPKAPAYIPSHLKSSELSPAHSDHPVPKPRSRRDSSGSPIPSPRRPRSGSGGCETPPPKPVRTFERGAKLELSPDPKNDPAMSGLMKSLAEVRAQRSRPQSDALMLDQNRRCDNPEPRPRRRSLNRDSDSERPVDSDKRPVRRPSPPKHKLESNKDTKSDVTPEWQREAERRKENLKNSNTPEAHRKKRPAPQPSGKPDWQQAAEERKAANKNKFNRFGSIMKGSDEADGSPVLGSRTQHSPKPARPESIPVQRQTGMSKDNDLSSRSPTGDRKAMRPARPPCAITKESGARSPRLAKDRLEGHKPPRPMLPGTVAESRTLNLTDRDKRAQGGNKLSDVIRKKTRSLNPFGSDSDEEEEEVKVQPMKPVVEEKKGKDYNPFDSDDDEDDTTANEETKTESPDDNKAAETVKPQTGDYDSSLNPFGSSGDEHSEESPVKPDKPCGPHIITPPQPKQEESKPTPDRPRKKITVDRQFDFDISLESSRNFSDDALDEKRKRKGRAPAPPRPMSPASPRPMSPASPLTVPSHNDSPRSASPRGVRQRKGPAPERPLPPKRHIESEPHISKDSIQRELEELDKKQTELELQGRELEEALRNDLFPDGDDIKEAEEGEDDTMLIKWFEMVNKKNKLLRRENDLVLIGKRQELEDRHSDVEYQIRLLMNKPENKKTDNEKRKEQLLLEDLVGIVTERSHIEEKIEMERVRAEEEDRQIAEVLSIQGATMPVDDVKTQKDKKKKDKKKKKK